METFMIIVLIAALVIKSIPAKRSEFHIVVNQQCVAHLRSNDPGMEFITSDEGPDVSIIECKPNEIVSKRKE